MTSDYVVYCHDCDDKIEKANYGKTPAATLAKHNSRTGCKNFSVRIE